MKPYLPFGQYTQKEIIHYEESNMDLTKIFGEVLEGTYETPAQKSRREKFKALGWDGKLHDKA
jgi:hypothetical protein